MCSLLCVCVFWVTVVAVVVVVFCAIAYAQCKQIPVPRCSSARFHPRARIAIAHKRPLPTPLLCLNDNNNNKEGSPPSTQGHVHSCEEGPSSRGSHTVYSVAICEAQSACESMLTSTSECPFLMKPNEVIRFGPESCSDKAICPGIGIVMETRDSKEVGENNGGGDNKRTLGLLHGALHSSSEPLRGPGYLRSLAIRNHFLCQHTPPRSMLVGLVRTPSRAVILSCRVAQREMVSLCLALHVAPLREFSSR